MSTPGPPLLLQMRSTLPAVAPRASARTVAKSRKATRDETGSSYVRDRIPPQSASTIRSRSPGARPDNQPSMPKPFQVRLP